MNALKDKKELDQIVQDKYISKIDKMGIWRAEIAIDRTKHRIKECRELLKEQPDQYWKDELKLYQDRLKRLKELV